jgi:Sec-independent protein translocase protein TatA
MNGIILFIVFIVFGRFTIPLALNLVVLALKVIKSAFSASAQSLDARNERQAKSCQESKPARSAQENLKENKVAELPYEQKVMKATAIIEDAYSEKDAFLDELYDGTEHPIFSVPLCLNYTVQQYEAQFGTNWTKPWIDALSLAFGVPFTYLGDGCYVADNAK